MSAIVGGIISALPSYGTVQHTTTKGRGLIYIIEEPLTLHSIPLYLTSYATQCLEVCEILYHMLGAPIQPLPAHVAIIHSNTERMITLLSAP